MELRGRSISAGRGDRVALGGLVVSIIVGALTGNFSTGLLLAICAIDLGVSINSASVKTHSVHVLSAHEGME